MGKYGFRIGKEREYSSYRGMRTRVENANHPANKRYKKLAICERWLGPDGFANFFNDLGPRPEGCTLDRVDNEKGYSPENCRWRTVKEQGNNRSTNIFLEYNGERLTMAQWSEKIGVKYSTIHERYRRGLPIEKILSPSIQAKRYSSSNLPDGISRKMVYDRIKKLHWSEDEAMTVGKQKNQFWRSS